MRIFRSVLAQSIAITAALVVTATTAAPALASGHSLVREPLQGIAGANDPVNPTQPIAGVTAGGAPWVVAEGSRVRLREDGRITVVVNGLIIPTQGANPVPTMAASLVCGDMVVDSTRPFAVSPEGNGSISDRIGEFDEDSCDNPTVLVRAFDPATGALGSYFAFAMDD
jgi:hypothetical protein